MKSIISSKPKPKLGLAKLLNLSSQLLGQVPTLSRRLETTVKGGIN